MMSTAAEAISAKATDNICRRCSAGVLCIRPQPGHIVAPDDNGISQDSHFFMKTSKKTPLGGSGVF
jgi:hypothetical protein